MHLYLVSASKNPLITRPLLDRIAEALEFQQFAHVAPFWQTAGIQVTALGDIADLPKEDGAAPLIIYDTPDQAGALGWHSYNAANGQVHGTAFVDPILQNGGSLLDGPNSVAQTLSHEAIEAAVDPYVNAVVFKDDTTLEPIEACDRVEGDSYTDPQAPGVALSNFLGPRAFRDGPGPYDWLRLLQAPWDQTPGGYCQRTNITTGETATLWGSLMPEWKRELKQEKKRFRLSRLANHRITRRSGTV